MSLSDDFSKFTEETGYEVSMQEIKESEGATKIDSDSLREACVRRRQREKKKVDSTNAAMDAYKNYMREQGRLTPILEKQLDYIIERGSINAETVKELQKESSGKRDEDFFGKLPEESKKATEIKEKYDVLVEEMKAMEARYEAGEITMNDLTAYADQVAYKIDAMKSEDRETPGVDLSVFFGN